MDHVHACAYVTAQEGPHSLTPPDNLKVCRVEGRGWETRQWASAQGPGCPPGGSPLSCPLSLGSGSPSWQVILYWVFGGTWDQLCQGEHDTVPVVGESCP